MKAKDFDEKFDSGRDVSKYVDKRKARRPNQKIKRVNLNFPLWMIEALDREALDPGTTRQSPVKVMITRSLDETLSSDK